MKTWLTICSLWFTFLSYSQNGFTLSGRVVNSIGEPLESATVQLLKQKQGVLTDSSGKFYFNNLLAGKYMMRVSYVGYENYQSEVIIKDGQNLFLLISLSSLDAHLNQLVVTGSQREVRKTESITNIDVYTTKHFQRNPYTNLHESLNMIPGLFADIDNGVSNTSDVQINGLEGNYTMFLIDGVPAFGALSGYYALNSIPMEMIDKIEILKGSASAMYGSEAIAGVINIKTKNPATTPKLSVNSMLTSMLETNTDITGSFKAGKAHALVSASGNFFNWKWDLDKDNFMDMPLLNRANFYTKFAIPHSNNLTTNVYGRYLFESRYGGEMQYKLNRRGSSEVYGEALATHQWQVGVNSQLPLKTPTTFMADFNRHSQSAEFGDKNYQGAQMTLFTQLLQNNAVDKTNTLTYGVTYRMYHYTDNSPLSNDSLNPIPAFSHIGSLYFEDEMNLHPQHKLVLGSRFEYGNISKFVVSPRVNYKYNTKNGNNILRIGAGTGYRVPNLLNEGFGALNGSRSISIEEKLQPESTISVNATYTRIQKLKGAILTIDANVFYTRFFNIIEPDYNDDPTLIVYENNKLGATAWGFNLYTEMNFSFPLKLGVGLSYNNVFEVELEDDGEKELEQVLHVPPFMANYYLSYTFPGPQLSIDFTGNIVSPMLLSVVPDDYRDERSPWYTIQNIQLTKKFRSGFELYFGLKNFFNFIQKDPILRPFDPFNNNVGVDNPNNYRFDTTYGFTSTQGIKAFAGFRYTLR